MVNVKLHMAIYGNMYNIRREQQFMLYGIEISTSNF